MLGSMVPVDSPFNPLFVTVLQCRNVRINVNKQKAIISLELYDKHQPIEQFNSDIFVPTKSTHEVSYKDNNSTTSSDWAKDMQTYQNSTANTTSSLVYGEVNYLTGIPRDPLRRPHFIGVQIQ